MTNGFFVPILVWLQPEKRAVEGRRRAYCERLLFFVGLNTNTSRCCLYHCPCAIQLRFLTSDSVSARSSLFFYTAQMRVLFPLSLRFLLLVFFPLFAVSFVCVSPFFFDVTCFCFFSVHPPFFIVFSPFSVWEESVSANLMVLSCFVPLSLSSIPHQCHDDRRVVCVRHCPEQVAKQRDVPIDGSVSQRFHPSLTLLKF